MQTLKVWLGSQIIYLYGTVNGEPATFTLVGDGYWQTEVERAPDNNYTLHLEAYSINGLEEVTDFTLYYGMMPLVTDRTQADANRVKALNRRIQKDGLDSLTEAEATEWLAGMKGAYNAQDLNRVGGAVRYLADVLHGYGYQAEVEVKQDWAREDFPKEALMQAYLDNVKALIASYYTLPNTPEPPESMNKLNWQGANDIEKLLVDIKEIIRRMEGGFRYCGTFNCNQGEVMLP